MNVYAGPSLDIQKKNRKFTYTGTGPSVVMMGFNPSFFLFLFVAVVELRVAPFPLAPAIRGTVVEGKVEGMAPTPVVAVDSVPVTFAGVGAVSEFVAFVMPFILAIPLSDSIYKSLRGS
ncbi:hypothetical protein F4777DRAFT_167064 [Nemania sp. FL0916]|nr:hypothetical protein F4777DRAFT_167064 [Nemania sp. FL0916]